MAVVVFVIASKTDCLDLQCLQLWAKKTKKCVRLTSGVGLELTDLIWLMQVCSVSGRRKHQIIIQTYATNVTGFHLFSDQHAEKC